MELGKNSSNCFIEKDHKNLNRNLMKDSFGTDQVGFYIGQEDFGIGFDTDQEDSDNLDTVGLPLS